jgi:hypothetical protein
MLAVRGILTSTVRSHARRSDRVVLVEAALLNELLRHYIAGREEDLYAYISPRFGSFALLSLPSEYLAPLRARYVYVCCYRIVYH